MCNGREEDRSHIQLYHLVHTVQSTPTLMHTHTHTQIHTDACKDVHTHIRSMLTANRHTQHTPCTQTRVPSSVCVQGGDPSVVVSGLGHPKGLALDWVGRNLYFTDSVKSRIELYSLDDKQRGLLLWKDIHTPQSLAIHLESK